MWGEGRENTAGTKSDEFAEILGGTKKVENSKGSVSRLRSKSHGPYCSKGKGFLSIVIFSSGCLVGGRTEGE